MSGQGLLVARMVVPKVVGITHKIAGNPRYIVGDSWFVLRDSGNIILVYS